MKHNQIVELYKNNISGPVIAKQLNISNSLVYKVLSQAHVLSRKFPKPNITSELKQNIIDYYNVGHSMTDAVNKFGFRQAAIRRILKGHFRPRGNTISMQMRANSPSITYEQRQCLLGSLLGDGYIRPIQGNTSYHYAEGHGYKQYEYALYKANLFGVKIHSYKVKSGYNIGHNQHVFYYHNVRVMDEIVQLTYVNGKKCVNESWLNQIDPIGIAYWFMDDGCSNYRKTHIATQVFFATMGFSRDENELLANWLSKLGIETHVVSCGNKGSGWQLHPITSAGYKLMKLIQPHVDMIPYMRYKIKLKENHPRLKREINATEST